MKAIKTIRAAEWWGYKLAPLLAIGYATAMKSGKSLTAAGPYLLYIMLALALGAAYVSVINDITDMEEDLAIGKKNRMAGVAPSRRWIFPVVALLAGAAYIFSFYPHILIMLLASMPWIAFSCYSIPPARLKKRGIWGVLADASGAHLFTSLFIVASMSYYTGQDIDWFWFGAVGIWALCYGLRGIFWHMFFDRENDIASGTPTFATGVDPERFRPWERLILAAEIIALGVMLWRTQYVLPAVFLVIYLMYMIACWRRLEFRVVVILMPKGYPYPYLIIAPNQPFIPNAPPATNEYDIGNGNLIADPTGTWLYIYFPDKLKHINPPGKLTDTYFSVARVGMNELLSAAFTQHPPTRLPPFTKYNNGQWNQPGIGGESSMILPGPYPPYAGDNFVTYSDFLNCYIVLLDDTQHISYAMSTDGVHFSTPVLLKSFEGEKVSAEYAVAIGEGVDPSRLGKQFYIFFTYYPTDGTGWNGASLRRLTVNCSLPLR